MKDDEKNRLSLLTYATSIHNAPLTFDVLYDILSIFFYWTWHVLSCKLLLWKLLNFFSCTGENSEIVYKRIKWKTSQVYDFQKVWIFVESEEFIFFLGNLILRMIVKIFAGCNIENCIESRDIFFLQNLIISKQFRFYHLASVHVPWNILLS